MSIPLSAPAEATSASTPSSEVNASAAQETPLPETAGPEPSPPIPRTEIPASELSGSKLLLCFYAREPVTIRIEEGVTLTTSTFTPFVPQPKTCLSNKKATSLLRRVPRTFVVPYKGLFYYYPIPQEPTLKNGVYYFNASFPVYREGFYFPDRNTCLYVTYKDLLRGVVRSGRKVEIKKSTVYYEDFINGTHNSSRSKRAKAKRASSSASTGSTEEPVPEPEDLLGYFEPAEDEVGQASVLGDLPEERGVPDSFDPEEEWGLP